MASAAVAKKKCARPATAASTTTTNDAEDVSGIKRAFLPLLQTAEGRKTREREKLEGEKTLSTLGRIFSIRRLFGINSDTTQVFDPESLFLNDDRSSAAGRGAAAASRTKANFMCLEEPLFDVGANCRFGRER